METPVTTAAGGTVVPEGQQQILISGAGGDQPLVMSAEEAAQFFQQAGIQWDGGSGQVVIGDVQEGTGEQVRTFTFCKLLGYWYPKATIGA